jgi:hypothetical protein
MKKFTGIMTSLFFLFLLSASTVSLAKKKPGKATSNQYPGITYVVTITPPETSGLCHSYRIFMADEAGNQVSSSKIFQIGIDTYIFHEYGPIAGIRTAKLERVNRSAPYRCQQVLQTLPDMQSGEFRNGSTYMFHLHPSLQTGHN